MKPQLMVAIALGFLFRKFAQLLARDLRVGRGATMEDNQVVVGEEVQQRPARRDPARIRKACFLFTTNFWNKTLSCWG